MRYVCTVENGRPLPSTIRRILVPVDFSEASMAALEYAIDLAGSHHASVDVLHVWELPPYPGMGMYREQGAPLDDAELLTTHVAQLAAQRLEEMVQSHRRPGVDVVGVLESGDPLVVVPRLAPQFDLVIIGAHDDSEGAGSLLFGNVADRLAGELSCPVIAVRRERDPDLRRGVRRSVPSRV